MKAKAKTSPNIYPFSKKPVPHTSIPMESKSAEQLLEDLTGILNNRKELLEKIVKKFPRSHDGHKTFVQYAKQTKKFLSALLAELSAYGDGSAGPDPINAYNDYWRAALKKWDTINNHRLIPFWRGLENILRNIYKKLLTLTAVLPPSFQTILVAQLQELETFQVKK
jgi:hypothetical protein